MVTVPLDSVDFRTGAVVTNEMLAVLEEGVVKKNAKAGDAAGVGLDLETVLCVQAWVRRLGEHRYAWVDLHVFDECPRRIRSETLPLRYLWAGEDGEGDVFGFEGSVYRGTGASPGSVWLAPDARKVQYRLYCECDGTVYSDGLLRQHDLPPDSELTNSGAPPSRRRRPPSPAGR